jgi:hypothetical protein
VFRLFITRLIILTGALAMVIAASNYFIPFLQSFSVFTWFALAFFFFVTLITGAIGFRGLQKSPYGFVASVNGMVALKLFLSVIFVIVYVLIAKPNSALFITSFFVLYAVFTVFEIRYLIIAQKNRQKQTQHGDH